jgi:hypothetical protein
MSLSFELTKVKDFKELLGDDGMPLPKTQSIIFSTISAGMGEITEKNYIEFYLRVAASDAMSQWPKGEPITLEQVRRHIGLKTNVFPMESRSKWIKRVMDNDIREIEYRIRRDAQANLPKTINTDVGEKAVSGVSDGLLMTTGDAE